jgi:hypothetical protein
VSGPVDSLLAVVFVPDQAPDAVQEVALADVHVSSAALPLGMLVGLALKLTVGKGGGGGVFCTVTVAVALALPPEPVQVSE